MKITINNKQTDAACGTTLAAIAAAQRLPDTGVAVAVNNEMVPRGEWEARVLSDGDDIVILKAFCGG